MSRENSPKKVMFLELNEISWSVLDRMIADGVMPNLARLKSEGTWASPVSVDVGQHLDPWVTWVTVHTGVDREVHGATVLGQGGDTINAKRTWDYVADAGKSIGVFGSVSAYPPRPVAGFMVPGPFEPGPEVYPEYLAPVQALNRRYTKVHNKVAEVQGPLEMAQDGARLMQLGLKPTTCAKIALQLAREKVRPQDHWRRVTLQPLVNYDFFETIYKRYRPDFATWHTNHCAHFMHHYWRAWDDSAFSVKASAEEKEKYGQAMPHGHAVADELIGRFAELIDDDTVLVIASGLGQQPYVRDNYADGRVVVRFKDVHAFLKLLGLEGITAVDPMMAPQWNVTIPNDDKRKKAIDVIKAASRTHYGTAAPEALSFAETGDVLTVTPKGLAGKPDPEMRYHFPGTPAENADGHSFDSLFVADQPTTKQGCHQVTGSLVVWGPGIARGVEIKESTNLDIAPTVLSIMGIPIPKVMKGRVLDEIWPGGTSARAAAAE